MMEHLLQGLYGVDAPAIIHYFMLAAIGSYSDYTDELKTIIMCSITFAV